MSLSITHLLKHMGTGCFALALLTPTGPTHAASETIIYSFQGGSDGSEPFASVINVGGTLYGTTYSGGAYTGGTVFSVNPATGAETVLHSFGASGDGNKPFAKLANAGGLLYGTTEGGGVQNCSMGYCGTVFSVNPTTSAETVVYAFQNNNDGAQPQAGLINLHGQLYGTTDYGGTGDGGFEMCFYGCGTVFSVKLKTVKETALYNFNDTPGDGSLPSGDLLDVGGMLYGTTENGGAYSKGTVFSVNPKTKIETAIYAFQGGSDGSFPVAGLINVGGTLYGTTSGGGSPNAPNCTSYPYGCGTVFAIDPKTGVERVVYSFQGGADGKDPYPGLVYIRGTLYGITANGGGSANCGSGCGTAFSVKIKTAKETVLHSFGATGDGIYPSAALIDVGGALYGTTEEGGATGNGTVFKLTP
jgi:uncharacterized repeat protein (TIGR03803 family)